MSNAKPIIAIDIDDVIADMTEGLRVWANVQTGRELTREDYNIPGEYWTYYDQVWAAHGMPDELSFGQYQEAIIAGKAEIPLVEGASSAIAKLQKKYKIILITARIPAMESKTQEWVTDYFADEDVELYFAQNPNHEQGNVRKTKGQICKELGAFILIDDHIDNCISALQEGIETIVFGNFGWQAQVPKGAIHCADWPAVLEYFNGRQ